MFKSFIFQILRKKHIPPFNSNQNGLSQDLIHQTESGKVSKDFTVKAAKYNHWLKLSHKIPQRFSAFLSSRHTYLVEKFSGTPRQK